MPPFTVILILLFLGILIKVFIDVYLTGWIYMIHHFSTKHVPKQGKWHYFRFVHFGNELRKPTVRFKITKDGVFLLNPIYRFKAFINWDEISATQYLSHDGNVIEDFIQYNFRNTNEISLQFPTADLFAALAREPLFFEENLSHGIDVFDSSYVCLGTIQNIYSRQRPNSTIWKQYDLYLGINRPSNEMIYVPAFTIKTVTSNIKLHVPYSCLHANGLVKLPKFIKEIKDSA